MKAISIFFQSKAGKRLVNFIIGSAAAVVMVGALFKLEHLEGASEMLTIGLTTEAFIFLLLGILPPAKDYYWEKVYPGLDVNPDVENYYKKDSKTPVAQSGSVGGYGSGAVDSLDKMFEEANVTPATIEKLGNSFMQLGRNVDQMSDISGAVNATNDYTQSAENASQALNQMSSSVTGASDAMNSFNNAAQDTIQFQENMSVMNTNLSSLNRLYETELNDANSHLKTMNQFYGTLSSATESMSGAAEDAQRVKDQMAQLSDNLTSLNQIYGNMLSAMSGRS